MNDSTDTLKDIERIAAGFADVALELTRRIVRFQEYVSKINGRIETMVHGGYTPPNGSTVNGISLWLHRDGKAWIIDCSVYQTGLGPQHTGLIWKRLAEAPVRHRIAGVTLFPQLLGAMRDSQSTLISEMHNAVSFYDSFERSLPIITKEEGV